MFLEIVNKEEVILDTLSHRGRENGTCAIEFSDPAHTIWWVVETFP